MIDGLDLTEGTYKIDVAVAFERWLPVRLPPAAAHVPREVAHQGRGDLQTAPPLGVLAVGADRTDAVTMSDRKAWTPADVVDVSGPPALLRNYLEQRDVRDLPHQARRVGDARSRGIRRRLRLRPADAGARPSRPATVVGFEREASLSRRPGVCCPICEFEAGRRHSSAAGARSRSRSSS